MREYLGVYHGLDVESTHLVQGTSIWLMEHRDDPAAPERQISLVSGAQEG